MKVMLSSLMVLVLSAGVLHAGERRLSLDEYRDKMKAALPDPAVVSRRISEQFLTTEPDAYEPEGMTRHTYVYGGHKHIHYSVVSLWVNALECARLAKQQDLEKRLVDAYRPLLKEKSYVWHKVKHVDFEVTGAVPLEIAILTRDEAAARQGLFYADRQWEAPREDDNILKPTAGLDPKARRGWYEQGYSSETRLWIDDMYMIGLLQLQAYRYTGDRTYLDRAAREMALYLDRLPKREGLFFHAPTAPFIWARGNGWMAGAMPMILKEMRADDPLYAKIMREYKLMMASLLKHQRASGLWGQLVDDAESWDETSGSAMYAYAFAEGVKNGWLGDEYRTAMEKAYVALVDRLDEHANLADVCVGTGARDNREWYMKRTRVNGDPHGQAPLLWLCKALLDKSTGSDRRPSDIRPKAAVGADKERISVGLEQMPKNPFGEPVRVEGVPAAICLKYEAATKRLYVGGDHALWVLDAADPFRPKLLGTCRGIGEPRQLCVQDGMVYVAARETGVWIIDAKDPSRPRLVTRFDTVELATGIDVCHPVLFCGQRHYGVEFIDVTDPAKPAHIKVQKTGESQSVVYRDGVLYSGDWGCGELTVIDAHDMKTAGTVRIEKLKGHGDGVDVDGRFVYASTGHHYHDKSRPKEENIGRGHGLEIFDISADPLKPRFVSRVQFPRFYSLGNDYWTPVACGRTVFCADTFNGVFAVDVSDPSKPETIGRITARTSRPKKDYDGNEISLVPVSDLATGDGVVYFAVQRGGLYLTACDRAFPRATYRSVVPKNAGFRAAYPNESKRFDVWRPARRAQARGAAAWGDVLYAACADAGLSILQRNRDGALVEVGRFPARFVGDVKAVDGRLYVAEGYDGVAVYDLADPVKPREIARQRDFGVPVNCALWVWAPLPGWIVVSNRESGYIYLRVSDDWRMKPVLQNAGCPGWDRYLADRAIGGKWIAQSTANTGFCWIDVSADPPKVVRSRVNRGVILGGNCAFRGDRLLRFPREGGIQYLAPGQAENADGTPWKADVALKDGKRNVYGQPAWNGENLLALTERNGKTVTLVDIADERAPKILWTETERGDPDASCWWNGRLVVPCGYQGLLVSRETWR